VPNHKAILVPFSKTLNWSKTTSKLSRTAWKLKIWMHKKPLWTFLARIYGTIKIYWLTRVSSTKACQKLTLLQILSIWNNREAIVSPWNQLTQLVKIFLALSKILKMFLMTRLVPPLNTFLMMQQMMKLLTPWINSIRNVLKTMTLFKTPLALLWSRENV